MKEGLQMRLGDMFQSSLASYRIVKVTAKTVLVRRIDPGSESGTDENTESETICRKVHTSGRVHIHISKHECAYI